MSKEAETATDATPAAADPLAITAEDAGRLLFLVDCAVRFTPQPQGGLNMAADALGLAQKLSAIQQGSPPT